MITVGLTGGIGSGKSTVASGFARRGAALIDADAIVREQQALGSPVLAEMVERFGDHIVAADGTLDRGSVAAIVFNDPDALADLNAITHPPVGREIRRRLGELEGTDRLVVLDIPLLGEGLAKGQRPRYPTSGILVVDTPTDVAVERLVTSRGFSADDARARIAAQLSRHERLGIADWVLDNSGGLDELEAAIEAAFNWASALPHLSD
ncbi:MAG: dephospho-CoA kinase [Acidimicrobiales bacterium]|nr:dephospho-CoA kinase [Acidimicrobiales bacterium]MYH74479.1 dephospho-CoA kinase [Acidimicrobiales bacterium]MYK72147.1 dephospho-CoA kinase [Acidimicrobiales bacterium]